MSRLYDIYKKLKNENKETIYLFKSGVFYISLEDDAKKLSSIYDFKLTNLNSEIVKCGFPCSSFDKYYMLFTSDKLKFKIIENNTIFDGNDYFNNQKISALLDKIDNININDLSISKAYNFIEEIQNISSSLR